MMNSDFYCLLDGNANNNLLKNTFDIEFSFILKNKFYRDIHGQGNLYKRKKYFILLKGKGDLFVNFDDSNLKFFSSRFLVQSDNHDFFCVLENDDKFQQKFEKNWMNFFKDGQHIKKSTTICDGQKKFGFPILNVCLVNKTANSKHWTLELIEK